MEKIYFYFVILAFVGRGSSSYYGRLAGEFPANSDHEVSGKVYVIDERRLFIKDFFYDGTAPDAHFYFGTSGSVSNTGTEIPDENGSMDPLGRYRKKSFVLTLPGVTKTTDIRWFSIWCVDVGVSFGAFTFPADLVAPAPRVLGTLGPGSHGTRSGSVTIMDSRTIQIESFSYDGAAPDSYFLLGKGTDVKYTAGSSRKVPDEKGSTSELSGYDQQTITIQAPKDVNIADYDWLSVYCIQASENFAHLIIPADLSVPPNKEELKDEYYGVFLGSFTTLGHGTAGQVYVVDDKRLFLKEFTFDGLAPDSYFFFNKTGNPAGCCTKIPDENGSKDPLKKYEGKNIVLTMPDGFKTSDILWLSVWCVTAGQDMGNVKLSNTITPPSMAELGTFTRRSHDVAGTVTLLDVRTVKIEAFTYKSGGAPDTFFVVGVGSEVKYNLASSVQIPNENGQLTNLEDYNMATITIRAPPGVNLVDFDWLSVYCVQAGENFGHVNISDGLMLPPSIEDLMNVGMDNLANCETLKEGSLNVHWEIDGDEVTIELQGKLDGNDAYMAFGLSGDPNANKMVGADVTVAWYDTLQPKVKDHILTAKAQCSQGTGACPDAQNDVTLMGGSRADGVTRVRYTRKLNTGDTNGDKVIPANAETAVVWALGKLTPQDVVLIHSHKSSELKKINFGRSASLTCTKLTQTKPTPNLPAWQISMLGGPGKTTFNFKIGQSGRSRGYSGITGVTGWGIAYYVDDLLIPEITLMRGVEYTFIIETGDNSNDTAHYHPVYITDDSIGGYVLKSDEQKKNVKVYAGLDASGKPLSSAVGRLCEYNHKGSDQSDVSETFDAFFKSLIQQCQPGGRKGKFTWIPDESTPDTVYYQCYQHRYLGWKIKVVDEFSSAANSIAFTWQTLCLVFIIITKIVL